MNLTQTKQSSFLTSLLLRFKIYPELAKSGIVTLVVISVTAGFFISHSFESSFPILKFLLTFFGILLLASGSSSLNQIQEIEIDKKMPRTKNRPLPTGKISTKEAVIFSGACIILGLCFLYLITLKVFLLGVLAVFSYNILYTLWWKKTHAFAAIPGALPGALPIYMGSVAANDNLLSPVGLYLFLVLFIWQMPHFWILALRYKEDYSLGGIPTLPVELGNEKTIKQIDLWAFAYISISLFAPLFISGIGVFYIIIAIMTSLKILLELWKFHQSIDMNIWTDSKREGKTQENTEKQNRWIYFFLWVNFSLILNLTALALNHWGVFLLIPLLT